MPFASVHLGWFEPELALPRMLPQWLADQIEEVDAGS